MYDEYKVTTYSTAEETGIITYDKGILNNPMFRGWCGDFLDGYGWMFSRTYANPDVEGKNRVAIV